MNWIFFIVFALILFGGELRAQVTMLSSNPLKKSQVMAFTSVQFLKDKTNMTGTATVGM